MNWQALHEFIIERYGPDGVRHAFYILQAGIGLGFIGTLWWMRTGKPSESGFAVREADLLEKRKKAEKARPGTSKSALGEARMERKSPLSLPGIRIDGPPHEILGVSHQASADEITRAYRDRMKQYHPDKVGRPGTREWTDAQKIAEALNRAKTEMLKRASQKR